MKLYSEDIIILKDLYANKITLFYDLHLKYRLSPTQILRSCEKFSKLTFFEIENEKITLSDLGIKWIEANKNFIFLNKFEFKNRFDKNKHYVEQIEVNSLYKPIIKNIDKIIFKEGE